MKLPEFHGSVKQPIVGNGRQIIRGLPRRNGRDAGEHGIVQLSLKVLIIIVVQWSIRQLPRVLKQRACSISGVRLCRHSSISLIMISAIVSSIISDVVARSVVVRGRSIPAGLRQIGVAVSRHWGIREIGLKCAEIPRAHRRNGSEISIRSTAIRTARSSCATCDGLVVEG